MATKFSVYKHCKTDAGWRYCKAAFYPNGKIKPNIVLVRTKEEKHTEGSYFLNHLNQGIAVGDDALEAQRDRMLKLNQLEYDLRAAHVVGHRSREVSIELRSPRLNPQDNPCIPLGG
jgi:hypothetical protein